MGAKLRKSFQQTAVRQSFQHTAVSFQL